MNSTQPSFFAELRRRHVWRVAVAYAVVAWLLLQLLSIVFPTFGAPAWVLKVVTVLLAAGFPVALLLAWAFEVTPEGVRRTEPASSPQLRPEDQSHRVGRSLNTAIIIALVLAVALLGWRLTVLRHAPAAPAQAADATGNGAGEAQKSPGQAASVSVAKTPLSRPTNAAVPAAAASIPEKSVAVLPFVNESGNKDEQFFSDGLSEDLITALSQFAGLKVISRNSAFQFRDSKDTSAQIGKLLGVAHLLEGSVQRAGGEVRITATLVNAADGSILWSQRYDKPYKDLFALQDAITQSVAAVLKAKLLSTAGAMVQSDRPPNGSLAAYAAYQRGKFDVTKDGIDSFSSALLQYETAVRLDPDYASAYAAISRLLARHAAVSLGGSAQREAYAKARVAADRALKLNPNLAAGYVARGYLLAYADFDWTEAAADYHHAVQLAPNDGLAMFQYGGLLEALGQERHALELVQRALKVDPRHGNWYFGLSRIYAALGRPDEARRAIETAISLQPRASEYHVWLTTLEIRRGHAAAALAAAQQEPPGVWHDVAMALALQIGRDRTAADAALERLVADHTDSSAYQIAEVYALRRDLDNTFKWLDRAWANRDPGISYLLTDALILRYRHDPRFAAFCKKVGLPVTTDAKALP